MRRNVSSQRHGCGAHFNLATDHTSFYERYGWQFYCMVQGDGEEEPSRLYIHTMQSVLLFAVPRKMSVRCDALIAPRKNPNDLWQYRIILSDDTASEVRQMLSQKRR